MNPKESKTRQTGWNKPHPREAGFRKACKALNVHPGCVRSTTRSPRTVFARECISFALYEGSVAMSYWEIAGLLETRSHTTVMQAVCRCSARLHEESTRDGVAATWRAFYDQSPPESLWSRSHKKPRVSAVKAREEAAC